MKRPVLCVGPVILALSVDEVVKLLVGCLWFLFKLIHTQ